MKSCSAFFFSPFCSQVQRETLKATWHDRRAAEAADTEGQTHTRLCRNEPETATSYREALQSHKPSSAQSSRNLKLQRRCPTPIYSPWNEGRQENSRHQLILLTSPDSEHLQCPALPSFIIVTLKVNDGDSFDATNYIHPLKEKEELTTIRNTYPIYCSVLLNFLARYLADALLGILTMDSSLP